MAAIINVAFVGAGNVNFGGPEGPWDHATRLQKYSSLHPDVKIQVVAIVDVDVARASVALEARKAEGEFSHLYATTEIHQNIEAVLQFPKEKFPDVVFIGLPPLYHGSSQSPFDLEIKLANAGILDMFVEKPLSCHPIDQVEKVNEVISQAKARNGGKLFVSVGYMLRYSSAVKKMKEILKQHGKKVVSTVARYNCAYNSILKGTWWDNTQSGGPIVEQGTHFCDLSRFFGGEVDLASVKAVCVGPIEDVGKLEKIPVDESLVLEENRIPRATSAVWKYKSGAIGSLNHALLLQGYRYHSEFEVWTDGLRLALVDPYSHVKLFVRTPESDEDKEIDIKNEDMYYNELSEFFDALRGGEGGKGGDADGSKGIRSTYGDALGSYALSWAIREGAKK